VVVVRDVVEDDGRPCIVMEHVPAPTLGIYLSAPDARRSTCLPVFDAVRDGFTG
jgi:hypothetical protein